MIARSFREKWLHPLRNGADRIETLIGIVGATSVQPEMVHRLSTEQSRAADVPVGRGFSQAVGESVSSIAEMDGHCVAEGTGSRDESAAT